MSELNWLKYFKVLCSFSHYILRYVDRKCIFKISWFLMFVDDYIYSLTLFLMILNILLSAVLLLTNSHGSLIFS